MPRDYLSDTPLLRAMGFLVSQHGQLGAIPPPPFLSVFPLEEHAKWRCDTPPSKGVSQRYLRDTLGKQGKWVRYPPLRYYLERVLRDMGGISHWAAKHAHKREQTQTDANKRKIKDLHPLSRTPVCGNPILVQEILLFEVNAQRFWLQYFGVLFCSLSLSLSLSLLSLHLPKNLSRPFFGHNFWRQKNNLRKKKASRRGGRNKRGRKQMRANANKRRQTSTNASKRRGENASKREQTCTNKRKQTLTPPLYAVFFDTPLCNPLKKEEKLSSLFF